jgi:hypothetical protein
MYVIARPPLNRPVTWMQHMPRTLALATRSLAFYSYSAVIAPLAYMSKIQWTFSTSSTERSRFFAVVHVAKIAKYLRSILLKLGYPQLGPTTLFEDNAAAILIVNSVHIISTSSFLL